MLAHKLEQKYSYADYVTWNENERWEILDGNAYMQAAPSRIHQEILNNLNNSFFNYLNGKPCKIYPAPFCVRLEAKNDDKDIKDVVEPDLTIVCDRSKLDDRGCKGAPDMVIEILSPSTGKNDKLIKFNKYEEFGVKEYWIVEPDQKIISKFVLGADGRYGRPDMFCDEDKISPTIFPDFEIDLKAVFEE